MDVRLPDGTVITNVPDGITKAELTAKLQANGYDVSKLGGAAEPESTGIIPSFLSGTYSAIKGTAQTAQTIAGGTPEAEEERPKTIGERGFMEDASLEHPIDTAYNWLQKAAYGLGKSAPELAGAIYGGRAGTAAGALVPIAGETGASELVGGVAGTAAGAGAMNIAKSLGPLYAEELKNNPDNPDAAFEAAISRAEHEGAITGISFAAFEIAPFKSAVKNILLQAFGVQPAIHAGATAAGNIAEGRDITEGITPESYAETALGTIAPVAVMHGVTRGYGKAKEVLTSKEPETPAYRERVESVVKEGYSIEDAEKIVTDAERLQENFSLDHEQALARAKAQWEAENEKADVEPDNAGAGGEPVDTGLGAGVSVPSGESTAEAVVGKPEEPGTDGLVQPDQITGPPGGGERALEPALSEQLPLELEAPETPTVEAPKVEAPPVREERRLPREFIPEDIEPLPVETPEVEAPEVTTNVVEPTPVPTPEAPKLSAAYTAAAEAVQARAATDPQNLITPAFIAKKIGVEIPEAKSLLGQLHVDGVLGPKVGEIGYKQIVKEEVPTTELPKVEAKAKVEPPSMEGLNEKLDSLYENDLIDDAQYRDYKQNIIKGKGLPNKVLRMLETEDIAPAEILSSRIEVAKPRTETTAPSEVKLDESKVNELDVYRDDVSAAVRRLLDVNKISPYEHSALITEVAKDVPNRTTIDKLLSRFDKRTPAEKPVALLDHINESDASQLILKRLDAKFKPQGARMPSRVSTGSFDNVETGIKNQLVDNTADKTGTVYGESVHHPAWIRNALAENGEGSKAVIYSDADTAVYRTLINGKPDYGVVRKIPASEKAWVANDVEVIKDTTAHEFADLAGIPTTKAKAIKNAIADYESTEAKLAQANPDGPFKGKGEQIVRSKSVDPRYADLLDGLLKEVNLKGLRIFLHHPEDIAGESRHVYGLHGDKYNHVDLHWDRGTMGIKTAMGDTVAVEGGERLGRDFSIGLAKGMSDRLTVETLTHEVGHIIDDVALRTASPKVREAIFNEHKKWYKKSQKMTPEAMLESLKTEEMGKQIDIAAEQYGKPGERIGNQEFDDYLRSFQEWWADNVARWMTTSEKPVGVIDQFFKSVADQLRKLLQTVTGKKFLPNKVVSSFLKDMQMGKRDYVADYLAGHEEMDMSDIFSTGYDYDYSKAPAAVRKAAKPVQEANEKIEQAEETFRVSTEATDQLSAIEQAIKNHDEAALKDAASIYTKSLKGKALDAELGLKPTSWLIENVEKQLPSMRQTSKLMDLLNGAKDKMYQSFSRMSTELNNYINKNGEAALRETISTARLLQVRASEWKSGTTLAEAFAKDDEIKAYRDRAAKATDQKTKDSFNAKAAGREKMVARVHKAWETLGQQEGGHAMYNKLLQFYKDAHNVVHGLLNKDIDMLPGLTPEQRAMLKKEADEAFKSISKGEMDEDGIFRRSSVESYFPWRRFGDYWLRVKPAKGKEGFHTFESLADLEKFKLDRARQMGVPHEGTQAAKYFEQGNDIETLRASIRKDAISPILQNMFKVIDAAPSGRGLDANKVKDDLIQLWLLTLPERSVRRQFLHSGDIPGMSMDLVRVFNESASVYANQIGKLQYGNAIRTQIQAARDAIKPSEKSEENLDPIERARLESFIEAISRRAEDSINPPERNQLISDANHLAHFYFLSSPSHVIRNMISVPMRILPRMSGRTNPISAVAMFTKYAKMYNVIKFEDANGNLIDPTLEGSKLLRDNKHLADMFQMGRDRNAYSGAGKEVIRQDMPRKRSYTKKAFRTVYDLGTVLFNSSERLSREFGFMMQAELMYNKFRAQGKSVEEAKLLAVEDAVDGIKSGIGEFGEFERPDIMRSSGKLGDAARAVFMFKMWSIAQTKFFLTYANKILIGKGLSTRERLDALHEMTGVLGMAALFGGVFALPAASTVFSTIDMLDKTLVSDDDPEKKKRRAKNPLMADSSEARFRYQWLPEHFGQIKVKNMDGKLIGLDQVIAQGPVSAYTGVDIGAKLSYNNMWYRSSGYNPTAVGELTSFIQNNLGPAVSLGVDVAEAADNFHKGDFLRGMSNLVPSMGKGFISAYRLEKEGAVTSKGVPIVKKENISEFAKAANAIGFTPTAVSDAYNRKSIITSELLRMNTDKQNIRDGAAMAMLKHEDLRPWLDKAREFNKRYPQPEYALTMEQIRATYENIKKNYTGSAYGVKLSKPEEWMYNQWYLKDRYK